ncbi:MAG: hypothetical protein A2675_01280 [Candidatus Yonathbacteria bacterium RIFCSPHIGHO2_01_FULL_51_10]|uniref:VanZ-like domain-containing protein n=1 Tax=Candidatus Yonathbacteria bacterium RIFCSPHIGHO2_01_FULL_51_10 TaxID=1802723 RepID=A0A1G2S861_9BACT|nr:MAG: hypothetical protein A2675_01280 [Candidatus Yonathbacteria bacterium RIFCSPHIGHO2_01_FULL_51_10]
MKHKHYPAFLIWLLVGIVLFNALAGHFLWYYHFLWLDRPMHLAAGSWIGASAVWILNVRWHVYSDVARRKSLLLIAVLCALGVGLLWEVVEYVIDVVGGAHPWSFVDTASDLAFDIIGGFVGGLYIRYRNFYIA